MIALEVVFWASAGLLLFAQVGYPLLLAAWAALAGRRQAPSPPAAGEEPFVAFVIAAHREAPVIAARVANVRELDWPAARLQLIVACDGSPDETADRARQAGADLALLPYREIDQSGVCFTALAFGTPMVLSAVGGFPEIAAAGANALVEPGDAVGLRSAVRALLDDPAARARLSGRAAELTRSRYDWDRIADRHLELYRGLLEGVGK